MVEPLFKPACFKQCTLGILKLMGSNDATIKNDKKHENKKHENFINENEN